MKKLICLSASLMLMISAMVGCGAESSSSTSSSAKTSSSVSASDSDSSESSDDSIVEDAETSDSETDGSSVSESDKSSASDSSSKEDTTESEKPTESKGNADVELSDDHDEKFVGKWEGAEMTMYGQTFTDMLGIPLAVVIQMEVNADGTITIHSYEDEDQTAKWGSNSDGTMTMVSDDESIVCSLDGKYLVMSETEDGVTVEVKLVKVDKFTEMTEEEMSNALDLSGLEGLVDGAGDDLDIGSAEFED